MTLLELQKALREGKAVIHGTDDYYFRIEDGQVAVRDSATGELIQPSGYFPLTADNILKDDTGYEIFHKAPILTEEERKYLADVIRPFRNKLKVTIEKYNRGDGDEYVCIHIRNDDCYYHDIDLAPFDPNEMYTGMELNREYSLGELGL